MLRREETRTDAPVSDDEIRIGVSSCLLGNEVRYDGGHKRDAFLVQTFGPHVRWVPVCPEIEIGLGVPRPTLRLQRETDGVRLRMPSTGADYTSTMRHYAEHRVAALAGLDLCGYIVKKDSPSCGRERVKVYDGPGPARRDGRGLFTEVLLRRLPLLPVEEEGRLNDPRLRESFVERVFAYRRLRSLFARRWTPGDLVAFHSAHKLQLLAHEPRRYEELGRLVAAVKEHARAHVRQRYEALFMEALATMTTVRRQVNVLQHMTGYFRRHLDAESRHELAGVIADYRRGIVPLIVPITLIRHHARRLGVTYLLQQTYLQPHPKELMLRNHV